MFRSWVILLGVLWLVGGCSGRGIWPFRQSPEDKPQAAATTADKSPDSRSSAVDPIELAWRNATHTSLSILRIDLPVDRIRHAEKLWNHVNLMRVAPEQAALLERNGLRVGVASRATWGAMEAIFRAARARSSEQQQLVRLGLTAAIEMGEAEDEEMIFRYDLAGRLAGRTMPPGRRVVLLETVPRIEVGGTIETRLGFEVRHDSGRLSWEQVDGIYRQVPEQEVFHVDDLDVFLTLSTGEFLVVGPSPEATGSYLMGSRFFTFRDSGQALETVLLITPRPQTLAGAAPEMIRP